MPCRTFRVGYARVFGDSHWQHKQNVTALSKDTSMFGGVAFLSFSLSLSLSPLSSLCLFHPSTRQDEAFRNEYQWYVFHTTKFDKQKRKQGKERNARNTHVGPSPNGLWLAMDSTMHAHDQRPSGPITSTSQD